MDEVKQCRKEARERMILRLNRLVTKLLTHGAHSSDVTFAMTYAGANIGFYLCEDMDVTLSAASDGMALALERNESRGKERENTCEREEDVELKAGNESSGEMIH